MAQPPPAAGQTASTAKQTNTTTDNNVTDTSLTIEDDQARLVQAQFTRLQQALGLKQKVNNAQTLRYSDPLPGLVDNKSTGIQRMGDVMFVCLDLLLKRVNDQIAQVCWGACKFYAADLADASPKDFASRIANSAFSFQGSDGSAGTHALSSDSLNRISYTLTNILEPVCYSSYNNRDSVVRPHDPRFHDHEQHALCNHRRNLILILPNRSAGIQDLEDLGCDPKKHLHIIDVIDVRDIMRTYFLRARYARRQPFTGEQRTTLIHQYSFSAIEKFCEAKGWLPPTGANSFRAVAIVRAAVGMAVKDATTTTWARTLEQIDGGQFPGPRRLSTWEDKRRFLSGFDLIAKKVHFGMEELEEMFESILGAEADEVAAKHALRYNYTSLLPEDIMKKYNIPTVRRMDLIDLIKAERSGSTRASPSATPKKDQELLKGLGKVVASYQQLGRDISKCLIDSLPEADKASAQTLYTLVTCSERGVSQQYPEMKSCRAFEDVASMVSKSGWKMNDKVAGWFVAAIMDRRKLRNWYDHLPNDDERFDHNDQHEHFLQTLIKVAKELLGLPPNF